MEPFLRKFFPDVYTKRKEDATISNYCKFDSQVLTLFTSSLYLAGLVASFCASSLTRAFGRKTSILTGGAAFLAGAALGGAAHNVYMLIFGRILLGIGVGFANQVKYITCRQYFYRVNNGKQINFCVYVFMESLFGNYMFMCCLPIFRLSHYTYQKWHHPNLEEQSTTAFN